MRYTFEEIQQVMANAGNNNEATDDDIRDVSDVLIQMSIAGTKTIEADDLDDHTVQLLEFFSPPR